MALSNREKMVQNLEKVIEDVKSGKYDNVIEEIYRDGIVKPLPVKATYVLIGALDRDTTEDIRDEVEDIICYAQAPGAAKGKVFRHKVIIEEEEFEVG